MTDTDLLSLSMTAETIEQRMAGVATTLAEGSRCRLQASKLGAVVDALNAAELARDMLDDLIHAIGADHEARQDRSER